MISDLQKMFRWVKKLYLTVSRLNNPKRLAKGLAGDLEFLQLFSTMWGMPISTVRTASKPALHCSRTKVRCAAMLGFSLPDSTSEHSVVIRNTNILNSYEFFSSISEQGTSFRLTMPVQEAQPLQTLISLTLVYTFDRGRHLNYRKMLLNILNNEGHRIALDTSVILKKGCRYD